ncbi:MAG: cytochrome P450, partial [Myxococcales bacterium]|nr:cytochrome P450 [Myxococcales bacterium]
DFLPADEVINHLFLLFWAGYDTTASAASWILHTLAYRPDCQERLREELTALDFLDLESLERGKDTPYTEWFLLEAERMYPSALFFPRLTLEDMEFQGHVIPEGTTTFYSPYMSHRDPGSFNHPNAFMPERWDPARPDRPKPSVLVGFGGGPRVCLGKAFAKLQLKLMLSALLRSKVVEPDPTIPFSVQAIPVHHPVNSHLHYRDL